LPKPTSLAEDSFAIIILLMQLVGNSLNKPDNFYQNDVLNIIKT